MDISVNDKISDFNDKKYVGLLMQIVDERAEKLKIIFMHCI